jgi:hypothetical protein
LSLDEFFNFIGIASRMGDLKNSYQLPIFEASGVFVTVVCEMLLQSAPWVVRMSHIKSISLNRK